MQLTNTPGKLVLPFANAGAKNTIPTASQIGITAGAASLTDGFPPLTRTPIAAGGVPPSGLDMNGILYELSAILRWANAGGGYAYDSTFANDSNVGGYPKGARIMRSDGMGYWFNTVENNTTDPEAAGAAAAGWVPDFTNGVTSVAMASANVTLTPLQYGKPIIVITGTLTANLNLIFPTIVNEWTVINNTTGPYTITCKTAAGTGLVVNTAALIVGDGTNIQSAVTDAAALFGETVATATGGTADAITATFAPVPRYPSNGVPLSVRATAANTTTTPTFTPNSGVIAAATIVKGNNLPLVPGDIAGAGHLLILDWDSTLSKWVLLNPAVGVNGRIKLAANLTLYVATTGNDSNTGLSVGSPFLTIQKAINTLIANYDLSGFTATIQLADGTYTTGGALAGQLAGQNGPSNLVINGNSGTPANVIVSTTAVDAFSASFSASFSLQNLKMQTTTSGNCISAASGGSVQIGSGCVFGSAAGNHINISARGSVLVTGNYSIVGNAGVHVNAGDASAFVCNSKTVTLTGTPAFSTAFAYSFNASAINIGANTYSGAATGVRYSASVNGVINANGGGATYLPGNTAGSTATGGQYV